MTKLSIREATPELWQAWLAHYHRDDGPETLSRALSRPTPPNRALARDAGSSFIALVAAEAYTDQEWMLQTHWIEPDIKGTALEAEALAGLAGFWTERLRKPGRKLSFRFRAESVFEPLRDTLGQLGYRHDHSRHEFRSPLAELPQPASERLDWRPALSVCTDRAALAALMDVLRQGDGTFTDHEPSADILAYYYAKLSDAELDRQVHVALRKGEPVAMVLLEVVPRPQGPLLLIPWMGLHPRLRGQGYGAEVHLHAFGMFSVFAEPPSPDAPRPGEYYGGTLVSNTVMLKLFARHGCKPYQTLEEWILD